jgi:hypothetical protein
LAAAPKFDRPRQSPVEPSPLVCSPFEPEWHSCSETEPSFDSLTDDESEFKNYWRLARPAQVERPAPRPVEPPSESPVFTSPELSDAKPGKAPRNVTVGSKSQPPKQNRLRLSVGGKPPVRQPRESEIHEFMTALRLFDDRENFDQLVRVFMEHEPEMAFDGSILDIDLATVRAETAFALIQLAKDVCQRKGVSYPNGN